ncbi:MATE family efflux transporter [Candidatus Ruminimicrobium bovinum]|uniref:MATE family efflux transporter n=1 Tax=Candidatus Ruminimicrobium bovinum TaxID=3242779 RepID=UPI0039B8EE4B
MFNLITNLPNHLKVTISAWVARGIIAITNLIAIKFLLPYLGTESYAVYLVLLSFTSWCALTDFGIGFSLQNYISEFRVKKQDYQPYINSAFQIIILFTAIAVILSLVLYQPIQSFILKKYTNILNVQTVNVVLASLILLIFVGVVNISTKVYYALQKGIIPNVLTSIAYIISFCAMLVVINTQSESNKILKIILCYTLPQLLFNGYLFIKIFKNSIMEIFKININILNKLFNRAFKFAGFVVISLLISGTDYFILAKTSSSLDVAVYSVFTKIFLAAFSINSCLLVAFWPIGTELYYSGQIEELKIKLKRYLTFGISLILITIIVSFLFKNLIFKVLLPNIDYNLSYNFFLLSALYFSILIVSDTYTVFLQSINVLKIFWIYMPIQFIISITLQYYFSLKYGINGIILGLLLSFLLTSFWLLPYKFNKLMKK